MVPSVLATTLSLMAALAFLETTAASNPSDHSSDPCMLGSITIRSMPTYFHNDPTSGHASVFAVCDGTSVKCYAHQSAYVPLLPIDCPAVVVESRRLAVKAKTSTNPSTTTAKDTATTKANVKTAKSNTTSTSTTTTSKLALDGQKLKAQAVPSNKPASKSSSTKRDSKTEKTATRSHTITHMKTDKSATKAATKGPRSAVQRNTTRNTTKHGKNATSGTMKKTTGVSSKTKAAHVSSRANTRGNSTSTTSKTADVICNHKGTRINGYQRLGDDPLFYAVCDESVKPPTLTCYQDQNIADSPVPDPEVPCMSAPPVSPKRSSTKTRTGSRHLLVHGKVFRPWPKGVVCFEFQFPGEPTLESVQRSLEGMSDDDQKKAFEGIMTTYENMDRRAQTDIRHKVRRAMDLYERSADIHFISTEDCKQREDREQICGKCQFWVQIQFRISPMDQFGAWSSNGFNYGDPRFVARYGGVPFQHLNLSPGYWKFSSILHELGHVLGMHHDHQHSERTVIVDPVVAKARRIPPIQLQIMEDLVGDYDPESIMHYRSFVGLCVPKSDYSKTVFCDIGRSPATSNCEIPVTNKHCNLSQSAKLGGRTLSAGDIRKLQQLYGHPGEKTPDFEAEEDDETYIGEEILGFSPRDLQDLIDKMGKAVEKQNPAAGSENEDQDQADTNDHVQQQKETTVQGQQDDANVPAA